jgi:hypothetical protein
MSSLFALGQEVAALHLALDAETNENGELPPSLVATPSKALCLVVWVRVLVTTLLQIYKECQLGFL